MEDCQRGLLALFAKQMDRKRSHRFESCIFRQIMDEWQSGLLHLSRKQADSKESRGFKSYFIRQMKAGDTGSNPVVYGKAARRIAAIHPVSIFGCGSIPQKSNRS